MATINEVGNRYGRLTVIGRAPSDAPHTNGRITGEY